MEFKLDEEIKVTQEMLDFINNLTTDKTTLDSMKVEKETVTKELEKEKAKNEQLYTIVRNSSSQGKTEQNAEFDFGTINLK